MFAGGRGGVNSRGGGYSGGGAISRGGGTSGGVNGDTSDDDQSSRDIAKYDSCKDPDSWVFGRFIHSKG